MASSGVSLTDALGATEALSKEFGDLSVANERNVETVLRMNKALGMSNDEAAQFLSVMQAMTGSTIEQAEALAAGATNMARAAGVAPQQVIQDMSANADSFADSFIGLLLLLNKLNPATYFSAIIFLGLGNFIIF